MANGFEEFLLNKFCTNKPEVFDDELYEAFNDWLAELDVDEIIKYANEYKIEG